MNILNSMRPVWAPDDDKGGGGDDGQKPDAAAEAAALAAAEAAKGKDGDKDDGAGDKQGDDEGGSFLDNADKPDEKKDAAKPGDWPEDWRDRMAGEDKDMRKRLDRFKAPADVFKSYTELEAKFKKGPTASDEPMPDAEKDPEKAAEWRKARGIPPDPTGYDVPDAVKKLVTDEDKPRLATFTEHMHKANVPQQYVGPALEYYFQEQAQAAEAIAAADKADQSETEDLLREEWGPDFRPNAVIAKRFAEEVTPGVNWFSARLPDGRVLGNIPDFVKALADMGRERFGDVSLAGAENTARTQTRKAELETMMREEPDKYYGDKKHSAEYEKIMDAELKAAGRSGAGNHSPKPT